MKGKEKACHEVGMLNELVRLPQNVREDELLQVVDRLNKDREVDGILVQLPLPAHILSLIHI